MKNLIVGVGHCCYDSLCTVEDFPPEDGSTHILQISNQGGGAVGTALAAASKLGMHTEMITDLGDDETGDLILEEFRRQRVGTSTVERIPGGRSSVSYVMVNPNTGSRTKFPYRDSLPPIIWTQERKELIADASVLHLDGTKYEDALNAARLARESGVTVSLDGCSMQWENEKNLELVSMVDILIMNARYPGRVSGWEDPEKALRYFATLGPRVLVSTQGSSGCIALLGSEIVRFPAFPVDAIDTTGAGDVFHGAFLAEYLRGASIPDCVRYASAVAAIKCTHIGGRAGVPTDEEARGFLREHG